jgi:serine/threonine protein kinase
MRSDPLVGRTVRQYEIIEPLGSGGFGTVYRARHRELGLNRALKVLHRTHADRPQQRARFLREARIMAQLLHPHVAAVHDVFDADDRLCIVMDLVPSQTLAERLEHRGALSTWEAARVSSQVASALDWANAHGIVHRDVKPSNILLREPDGTALLCDFGIAVLAADKGLTATGAPVGTPGYMSPEQLGRGSGPIDGRSDVYSLAAVLHEMVTGQPPWIPVGQPRTSPTAAVAQVLARGLAHDPVARPATAGALAREFAAAAARTMPPPPRSPPPERRRTRWTWPMQAGVCGVLVLWALQPTIVGATEHGAHSLLAPSFDFTAPVLVGLALSGLMRWRWAFWINLVFLLLFGIAWWAILLTNLSYLDRVSAWTVVFESTLTVLSVLLAAWMLLGFFRYGTWAMRRS